MRVLAFCILHYKNLQLPTQLWQSFRIEPNLYFGVKFNSICGHRPLNEKITFLQLNLLKRPHSCLPSPQYENIVPSNFFSDKHHTNNRSTHQMRGHTKTRRNPEANTKSRGKNGVMLYLFCYCNLIICYHTKMLGLLL